MAADPNSSNWLPDPAKTAAANTENTLKKIPLPPRPETFEPPQIGAAAAAFAVAVRKLQAAEAEIVKIKADQLARDKRVAMLKALKVMMDNKIVDVWCANYTDDLAPDTAVKTMEVPGHWIEAGENRTSTIYKNTPQEKTVSYYERSLNIAPDGIYWPAIPSALLGYPQTLAPDTAEHGRLVQSEGMTDAQMFVNLALEPGNEKWRPLWRYGILLLVNKVTSTGTVRLNSAYSRAERGAAPADSLPLDGVLEIENVPIIYPPCGAEAFAVDDEVLVLFQGQDRNAPAIIGFRREPKQCPADWKQIR